MTFIQGGAASKPRITEPVIASLDILIQLYNANF